MHGRPTSASKLVRVSRWVVLLTIAAVTAAGAGAAVDLDRSASAYDFTYTSTISGTVHSELPTGGNRLTYQGSTVFAQAVDPASHEGVTDFPADIDKHGRYSLSVPDGSYRLYFSELNSDNAPVWWGNTVYRLQSKPVTMRHNVRTGVDAVLPLGASISGTITAADDSYLNPRNVRAYLINPETSSFDSDKWVTATTTWPEKAAEVGTGSYRLSQLNPGKYLLRFEDFSDSSSPARLRTEYWPDSYRMDEATYVTVADGDALTGFDVELDGDGYEFVRYAGADRFETAASITHHGFAPGVPVVYIANGLNYPDALSGGPAASLKDGALLLVTPTTIPASISAELSRLKPSRIVILGGPAAVSVRVERALKSFSPVVERIGGKDRYAVSRAVASKAFAAGSKTVYMATGRDYPDALAAGAVAGSFGAPVLLVDGMRDSLDAESRAVLRRLGAERVVIVGGNAAVSSGIGDSLSAMGITDVERYHGRDRYETAGALSGGTTFVADTMYFATGSGYADALVGGALASAEHSPLTLVRKNCVRSDFTYFGDWIGLNRVVLLGGTGVISNSIRSLKACPELPY